MQHSWSPIGVVRRYASRVLWCVPGAAEVLVGEFVLQKRSFSRVGGLANLSAVAAVQRRQVQPPDCLSCLLYPSERH